MKSRDGNLDLVTNSNSCTENSSGRGVTVPETKVCFSNTHKNLCKEQHYINSLDKSGREERTQKIEVCYLDTHKNKANCQSSGEPTRNIVVFSLNVRGLVNDDRIHELLVELRNTAWDFVLVSETWRGDKAEFFEMSDGHTFVGSGGEAGKRGVGIMIDARWKKFIASFNAISSRVCEVQIVSKFWKAQICSVYFPHGGYSDPHVQEMYTTLQNIRKRVNQRKSIFIVGGDFNARVGIRSDLDSETVIGAHGYGEENDRGLWLKNFCALENLSISNTYFPKPDSKKVTYTSPQKKQKQLDYILVASSTMKMVHDAGVMIDVNLGSDHKALYLKINTLRNRGKSHRKKKQASIPVSWKQVDVKQFGEQVSEMLKMSSLHQDLDTRSKQLAAGLALARNKSVKPETTYPKTQDELHLESLIEKRRLLPHASPQRTDVSKEIRKQVRKLTAKERRSHISDMLDKFADLKNIHRIKTRKKRQLMISAMDRNGVETTDRQSIADIFADFYRELYASPRQEQPEPNRGTKGQVKPFSLEEIQRQLKRLKSKRAADGDGVVAEMLKYGGIQLQIALQDMYNEILKDSKMSPKQWRKSVVSVLYKSGDTRLPQNYRPITIIPILYKLFAMLLYSRLQPILEHEQSKDQAGFRKNFSTVDHLFTLCQVYEKCEEYQLPLWVSAIDFKKAFDTISHNKLWEALRQQKVEEEYINLLKHLYANQIGQVRTDVMSKPYKIERGTKQGDPLSSLLFNAFVESILRNIKAKWTARQYGVQVFVGVENMLTNLRYADDILLFAKSQTQLQEMLTDLSVSASACGLELHPDKTKVVTNARRNGGRGVDTAIRVQSMDIQVLDEHECFKYLGRKVCFLEFQKIELQNRVKAGWAKFTSLKQELTSKAYALKSRLRLFEAVVTPTVLYGAGAWSLTKRDECLIQKTQRHMLRLILGSKRKHVESSRNLDCDDVNSNPDEYQLSVDEVSDENEEGMLETWVEWIRRTTREAEGHLENTGIEKWITQIRRQKWRCAQRHATLDPDRWSHVAMIWNPLIHYRNSRGRGHRKVARPKTRWVDDVAKFASIHGLGNWINVAFDEARWMDLECEFVKDEWRYDAETRTTMI